MFCTLVLWACSWAFCTLQFTRNVSSENNTTFLMQSVEEPTLNLSGNGNVNATQGLDIPSTTMLAINVSLLLSVTSIHLDIPPADDSWGRYHMVPRSRRLARKHSDPCDTRTSALRSIRYELCTIIRGVFSNIPSQYVRSPQCHCQNRTKLQFLWHASASILVPPWSFYLSREV